jgi:hypothetical protein
MKSRNPIDTANVPVNENPFGRTENAPEDPGNGKVGTLNKAEQGRGRDWDKEHPPRSYRGISDEFHNALLAEADYLGVPVGELLAFLAAYGWQEYKAERLELPLEPRSRRMTVKFKWS